MYKLPTHSSKAKIPIDFDKALIVVRVTAGTSKKLALLFLTGFCFGFRIQDLVRLTKHDLKKRVFDYYPKKINKNKGYRQRRPVQVVVPPIYLKLCRELKINLDQLPEYPFKSQHGNFLDQSYLGKRLKHYCRKAGFNEDQVKRIGTHTLRKTWACEYLKSAKDKQKALTEISILLGHRSEEITRYYLGLHMNDIIENMKEFGNY